LQVNHLKTKYKGLHLKLKQSYIDAAKELEVHHEETLVESANSIKRKISELSILQKTEDPV
jgi:predicted component of type VI protein secretion system